MLADLSHIVRLPAEGCLSSLAVIICSVWGQRHNLLSQHLDKSWKYSKHCHLLKVGFYRKGSHISHHFLIFFPPQKSIENYLKHVNFTLAYFKTNYHEELMTAKPLFTSGIYKIPQDLIITIPTHSARKLQWTWSLFLTAQRFLPHSTDNTVYPCGTCKGFTVWLNSKGLSQPWSFYENDSPSPTSMYRHI